MNNDQDLTIYKQALYYCTLDLLRCDQYNVNTLACVLDIPKDTILDVLLERDFSPSFTFSINLFKLHQMRFPSFYTG